MLPILSQVAGHLLLLKSSNYSRLVSKEILCTEIQIVLFNKFNTKIALYPAISHHFSTFLSIKQHANLCPRSLHINFRLYPYPAKSHRLVGCFNSKSYNTAHICHFVFSTPPDRITNTLCKIATLPFRSVQCCIFTQGITIPVVL